jgi:hypothetical protein
MTWQRISMTSLCAFVVVFALLAGRMTAGADPGLDRSATKAKAQVRTTTKASPATQASPATPVQTPTYSTDPYAGSGSQTTSDPNPPVTHSS